MKDYAILKKRAIEIAKREEGLGLKPYLCSAGKASIGYGRNLEDVGISVIESEFLLNNDIDNAFDSLDFLFPNWDDLPERVKVVLALMSFQMGRAGLIGFKKTLAFVRAFDFENAAKEMLDSIWATEQTPGRANRMSKIMRGDKDVNNHKKDS